MIRHMNISIHKARLAVASPMPGDGQLL